MSSLLLNTPPRCRSSYGGRDGSYSWPGTPPSSPLLPAASPDPRVEELVKRLEETCDRVSRDAGISVMKNDPDSAAFIPLRVKEIIQECLTPLPARGGGGGVMTRERAGSWGEGRGGREVVRYVEMVKEGRGGKERKEGRGEKELETVRYQLTLSQRENEELGQKYIAVSEKVEEIFRLKAEVSRLMYERASLTEEKAELQRTLLDQETSFSYTLRCCQSERSERDQLIGRLEAQLNQSQTRCTELELELSTEQTLAHQQELHHRTEMSRLHEEVRERMEEVERVRREGREEGERVRGEMGSEVERVRREGEEKAGQMGRQGEEELVKIKKGAEERERKLHMEIKEALSKAEAKVKRVEELTLINEHLQEQLAESRGNSDRLSGDVHRLSVSLSAAQNRASEMESEHRERLTELERANCGLRKMRERVTQVEGERERAGNEVKKTRDVLRRTEAELERVRERVTQVEGEREQAGNEVKKTRAVLRRTEAELERVRERVAQVEGEGERAGNEVKKTRDVLRRTEAELERVKEETAQREADTEKSRQVLEQQIEGLTQRHSQEENRLSERLEETEGQLERETSQREELGREVAALSESLAQHRDLLEEAKHQRTTLNKTVASLAQEKADILREKVTLEVRVESLTDTIDSLKRKLGLVTKERDRLQEAVKDSEKRVFLAELNRSVSTSRDGSCTRDPGSPVCSASSMKQVLPSLLPHADDARHEELLTEYRPLCETLSQLREREAELSSQLQELGSQYETRLRTAREHHGRSIEKIKHKHDEMRERWNVETEVLKKKLHDTQVKMQALSMELQTAKKTAEEREREKAEWMKERDTQQKELEAERQRGDEAREHLASVAATHSENVASVQQKLEKMERETEKLLNGKNELLSSREELRTALERAEERNYGLEQSLASTTGELEEHLQKLSKFDAEVERLQQSLLECQQEREKEVRGIQTQLTESQTHCQRLQREKEGLESALVSTQSKCSSLESELLVIKGQLSSVTTQLDSSHLSQSETEANYHALLAAIEHTISERNPLHTVESTAGKPCILESPEAVIESLVRMKNERDALREGAAQTHESLEQLRAGLKSATEEREEAKATVQHLQSSLQALQAELDQTSKKHEEAVVHGKENESRLFALQTEKEELKISLETQVKSLSLSKETLGEKSAMLEGRLKEAEKVNKTCVEDVLKLTNTVTVLKSSQVNRDRAMAELEERLRATQREVVQGELNLKTAERKRLALEKTVAQFEQQSLKQENTKRELQSHARHLVSQLKQIKEKSQSLRHELTISEAERETLRGDVEQLSVSLQSATSGKVSLARSQEREIGRLRGEVGRQLQENSALKRELVQSTNSFGGSPSSSANPLVDGLISSSDMLELRSSQARNFLPTPPSASSTPRKPS